eukprot:Em0002g71a
MNSFVLIAKCIKAVSGNSSDGTRKQSVRAGLFVTFAMDGSWVSRHGNNTSNMRYHITSVHGIKALQQGSKKEEMGSSCSTNTASATTSVKGAGSMDKFVQPVTVMKGEKLDRANELLVNALTANLLPSALLDSPELRKMDQRRQSHQQKSQCVLLKRKISTYSLAKRKMKV